jgi:hypothetical protein
MTTTTNNELIYIGKTVKTQIGMMTMMSIGGRDFKAMPETETQRGGLRFTVGRNRLTQVVVRLMWNDTYTVEFVKVNARTRAERVVKSYDLTYCDQLSDLVYELATNG